MGAQTYARAEAHSSVWFEVLSMKQNDLIDDLYTHTNVPPSPVYLNWSSVTPFPIALVLLTPPVTIFSKLST